MLKRFQVIRDGEVVCNLSWHKESGNLIRTCFGTFKKKDGEFVWIVDDSFKLKDVKTNQQ